MKKSIWIFLLAVMLPGVVLGWLALRSAGEQQIIFERRTAELYQKETEDLAAAVRETVEGERRAFSDVVHRLLGKSDAQALARDFTNTLTDAWSRKAVGFVIGADGQMLSPGAALAKSDKATREFLWENSSFLCSTQPAVVYPVPVESSGKSVFYGTQLRARGQSLNDLSQVQQGVPEPEAKPALVINKEGEQLVLAGKSGTAQQAPRQEVVMKQMIQPPVMPDPGATTEAGEKLANPLRHVDFKEAPAPSAPLPAIETEGVVTEKPLATPHRAVGVQMPAAPAPEAAKSALLDAPLGDAKAEDATTWASRDAGLKPGEKTLRSEDRKMSAPAAAAPLAPKAKAAPAAKQDASEKFAKAPAMLNDGIEIKSLAKTQTKEIASGTALGVVLEKDAGGAGTNFATPTNGEVKLGASTEQFWWGDGFAGGMGGVRRLYESAPMKAGEKLQDTDARAHITARSREAVDKAESGFGATLGRDAQPILTMERKKQMERFATADEHSITDPGQQSVAPAGNNALYFNRQVEPQQNLRAQTVNLSAVIPSNADFNALTALGDEGMVSRFVQDKLGLIFWIRPPEAPELIFGCLIEAANLRELWSGILGGGDDAARDGSPSFILALLDDKARPVTTFPTGDVGRDWKRPFVASEIGEVLPHWETALYLATPTALADTARGLRRTLSFTIVAAVALIALGGWLVVADVRRQLALAQKKTDFVSNVSHELKTPLTSIRMFAELMHDRPPPAEKQGQYLRIITAEAERLTRLINNVLDFAKLERHQKRFDKRPLDLHAVITRVWEGHEMHLREAGFTTKWEAAPGPYHVTGDEDALAQILVNLLSNAEKYSAEKKDVELVTWLDGNTVNVSVLDRGLGVPAGEERKIFESFYRAHDSLSSGIQGSGLGLTLARRLATEHGGKIIFERRSEGGSRFTLSLPLAA